MTEYFVDMDGKYLGGFDGGAKPPEGSIKVPYPPQNATGAEWDGTKYNEEPALNAAGFYDAFSKASLAGLFTDEQWVTMKKLADVKDDSERNQLMAAVIASGTDAQKELLYTLATQYGIPMAPEPQK